MRGVSIHRIELHFLYFAVARTMPAVSIDTHGSETTTTHGSGPVFTYKLRYIVGFGLVKMAYNIL